MEQATFAGGCFWCTEAVFQRLKGVESVVVGYSGGKRENPSYEQVSTGVTGHAEAIQITFNPEIISYDTLLEVFWKTHDPTSLNRQGADVGSQYRSIIFYYDEKQRATAEDSLKEAQKNFPKKIVTEVVPFVAFYKAEVSHQEYYNNNRFYPYCTLVIDPKIKKLYKDFKPLVKDEEK